LSHHNIIGNLGEIIASNFLRDQKNYTILENNWRFSHAEIDIIAKDKETLVFVEVKTRSSGKFGRPEEFITDKKILLIQDAANEYMKFVKHEWSIRFDIISIILRTEQDYDLEHYIDAWW